MGATGSGGLVERASSPSHARKMTPRLGYKEKPIASWPSS